MPLFVGKIRIERTVLIVLVRVGRMDNLRAIRIAGTNNLKYPF